MTPEGAKLEDDGTGRDEPVPAIVEECPEVCGTTPEGASDGAALEGSA